VYIHLKAEIGEVLEQIKSNQRLLSKKHACIGFDGFVDSIIRVVRQKSPDKTVNYFETIEEFGSFLISKKGQSCSVELKEHLCKMGGNMPIFANALGNLGVTVTCVGALGYPEIHPLFQPMALNNCTLHSFCNPGLTSALEFNDGKVMLIQIESLDQLNWANIKMKVGLDRLIHSLNICDLIGIVNWSEIENTTDIWKGFLREVVPQIVPEQKKIVYFDLADCSKRNAADIQEVLQLMPQFGSHFRTILGMNENEARMIDKVLFYETHQIPIQTIGERIYKKLGIDILVIHPREGAWAWERQGCYHVKTRLIEFPKISTGGGDNFNAGFGLAQLLGLDLHSSLIIANAVSGFYVQNGFSPNFNQLVAFLKEWQETER
jgi:hypothetical protein